MFFVVWYGSPGTWYMCQSLPGYCWIKLEICASLNMNVKKMLLRWLIMTMKYFVVNVALGGVLNLLVFGPLESWLCGYFELSEFSDRSGH